MNGLGPDRNSYSIEDEKIGSNRKRGQNDLEQEF